MLTKFSPAQSQEIKQYYAQNGYVIVSKLLDQNLIDNFLVQYNRFKSTKFLIFRSQDTNRSELVQTNEQGFLEHSILDPMYNIPFAKWFSNSVDKCITSSTVSEALKNVSGKNTHTVWQTMFFDKSTGTVAHQDHYYLDTEPSGNLVAAWFALEDIHPDAGCFFVVPGSHLGSVVENKSGVKLYSDHEDFVAQTQKLIEENNYQFQPCALEKGDVLFWHPFLVHGAFKNSNPSYSRKSFTAHYIPESYNMRHFTEFPETVPSSNASIRVWKETQNKTWHSQLIQFCKLYVKYIARQIMQFRPKMEMRSVEYEQGTENG